MGIIKQLITEGAPPCKYKDDWVKKTCLPMFKPFMGTKPHGCL
jgi:hypothetical protein